MATEFVERRLSPRTGVSLLTRIRPVDSAFPAEYCTSINVSHSGVYFKTSLTCSPFLVQSSTGLTAIFPWSKATLGGTFPTF
jgi:hypothetical protein